MWKQFNSLLGIALQLFLLFLLTRNRLYKIYPVFYSYIALISGTQLLLFFIYALWRGQYTYFYWPVEFLHIGVGCALLWEIYSQTLESYPGVLGLARRVFPIILLAVIFRTIFTVWFQSNWLFQKATFDLERDLRAAQAVCILVLLALLLNYDIPVGRNLSGILGGYALYICMVVIVFPFLVDRSGIHLSPFLRLVPPAMYVVSQIIWCWALYSPDSGNLARLQPPETRRPYPRTITARPGPFADF